MPPAKVGIIATLVGTSDVGQPAGGGAGRPGPPRPRCSLPVYNQFLGDFQNRDMALLGTIVHTRELSYAPGSPLRERAYRVGGGL